MVYFHSRAIYYFLASFPLLHQSSRARRKAERWKQCEGAGGEGRASPIHVLYYLFLSLFLFILAEIKST